MRHIHFLTFSVVLLLASGTAWGQLGLYGSPEVLQFPRTAHQTVPQMAPRMVPQPGYANSVQPTPPVYQAPMAPAPANNPPAYNPTAYNPSQATAGYQPAARGYSYPMMQTAGVAPAAAPRAPARNVPLPPNAAGRGPAVVNQAPEAPTRIEPIPTQNGPTMMPQGGCAPQAGCAPQGGCMPQGGRGVFEEAISQPCEADALPCTPAYRPWYASLKGLAMMRNNANKVWTSYDPDNPPAQMTNTNDINLTWRGGFEVRFGRKFSCGQWGVEATYWTLEPFTGFVSTLPPGANGVSTPLDVSGIEFAGENGVAFFDNSEEHRLWRRDEVHNLEINFIRDSLIGDPSCRFNVQWLAGVRYFRFEDKVTFGALQQGAATWGQNGGVDEAYLSDQIENNLIGLQCGADAGWRVRDNVRLYAAPRIGIYNNQIHNVFRAYRGDGLAADPTAASGMVGIASYPVNSLTNCVSFLTQLDLGVQWQFLPCWSASVGYRVLAITNMGLADHQIPHYIVDTPEIADIDTNGDLILHGAFVGVEYNF